MEEGGVLEMHGQKFAPTWTRLAASTTRGATSISLHQPVDWEVGQTVAIMTTQLVDDKYSSHQNEMRLVSSVSADGTSITLDRALEYDHYGGPEYAAEVALLSRNVVVEGDAASETVRLGGHILCDHGAICHIASVEAYRMGQENVLGRYPFHLHMMGDNASDSYFEDCAVHHSYFRAFTVHASSFSRLSRNVAYDISGSAFYLEDGIEEHNLFEFNLAAFVHLILPLSDYENGGGQDGVTLSSISSRIVPTDATAAGYYCTNAKNRWIGNAASGGFAGFHFPEVPLALGLSASQTSYRPDAQQLLEFDSNTAHSSGSQWSRGACLYIGGALWEQSPGSHHYTYKTGRHQPGRRSGHFLLKNLKVFACRKGVLFWGTHWSAPQPGLMLEGYEAHDVQRGSSQLGETYIRGGVISAHTSNHASDLAKVSEGFELYDTDMQTILVDVQFRNFDRQGDVAIMDMTHSNIFKQQGMFHMKGITFENVPNSQRFRHVERYAFDTYHNDGCKGQQAKCPGTAGSSQTSSISDADGTSIGWSKGAAIMGADDAASETNGRTNEWWYMGNDCEHRAEWGFYVCPSYGKREVVSLYIVTGLHDRLPATVKNRWGPQAVKGEMYHFGHMDRKIELGLADSPMVTGPCCDIGWYMQLDGNMATQHLTFYLDQMVPGSESEGLILATTYPKGASFTIQRCIPDGGQDCTTVSKANNLEEVLNSAGTKYHVNAQGTLFMKFVDERNDDYFQVDGVRQLRNGNRFHAGKGVRYKVTSSLVGQVGMSLPSPLPGYLSPGPSPTTPSPPTPAMTLIRENQRCSGPPEGGWGGLGNNQMVSETECKQACLNSNDCKFAVYKLTKQKCSKFLTCNEFQTNGANWKVWAKTTSSEPTLAPTPAPTPTPTPTPAPTPAPTSGPTPTPGLCKPFCSTNSKPWSTKCNWNNCKGCSSCPQNLGQCESWCADHATEWTEKCLWDKCSSCSACAHGVRRLGNSISGEELPSTEEFLV